MLLLERYQIFHTAVVSVQYIEVAFGCVVISEWTTAVLK